MEGESCMDKGRDFFMKKRGTLPVHLVCSSRGIEGSGEKSEREEILQYTEELTTVPQCEIRLSHIPTEIYVAMCLDIQR